MPEPFVPEDAAGLVTTKSHSNLFPSLTVTLALPGVPLFAVGWKASGEPQSDSSALEFSGALLSNFTTDFWIIFTAIISCWCLELLLLSPIMPVGLKPIQSGLSISPSEVSCIYIGGIGRYNFKILFCIASAILGSFCL